MITTNHKEFALDLERVAKEFDTDLNLVIKKTAFDLYRGICEETSVDKGFLRSKWEINLDSLPGGDAGAPPKDKMSAGEINALNAAQEAKLSKYDKLRTVYIYNSVPYAIKIEAKGGKKKPPGMVARTIVKVECELEAELNKLRFHGGGR